MAAVTEKFFDERYKEVGVVEFFRKNLHMLGYSGPIRSFTTLVHEYVTNALDACEEGGIMPDIKVTIRELEGENHYLLAVEDNGTGIPESYIPKLFGRMLTGTKFHRYLQQRGQQGIGSVGAMLYSQITTGRPIKIISSTGEGEIDTVVMEIDVKKNDAKIHEASKRGGDWRGTKIVAEYKDILYRRGEQGPFEYLRRTSIANPHARIELVEPDGTKTVWDRVTKKLPAMPKEMKPHPKGLIPDDIKMMAHTTRARKLRSFLERDFTRVSKNKVDELEEEYDIKTDIDPHLLTHKQAEELVEAFKKMDFYAPPTDGLVPIGEPYIEKSFQDVLEPEFLAVVERAPSVYSGGIPFIVEVGLAYGGKAGREGTENPLEIMRFANRVPLIFDAGGCLLTKAVHSVDWKRYGLKDVQNAPLTVFINIVSPHIPYKSAGKLAIADDDDVKGEVRFALMEAGRKLKRHLGKIRRAKVAIKKKEILERYVPEVAFALAYLTGDKQKKIEKELEELVKSRFEKQGIEFEDEEEEKKSEEKSKKKKSKKSSKKKTSKKSKKSKKKKSKKSKKKSKKKKKEGGK